MGLGLVVLIEAVKQKRNCLCVEEEAKKLEQSKLNCVSELKECVFEKIVKVHIIEHFFKTVFIMSYSFRKKK